MTISARSMLTAGVSAVGACAVVLAPSVVPPAHNAPTAVLHVPVTTLAASFSPLAQKLLQPVVDALDDAVSGQATATAAAVAPANAASNLIDSVYSISRYWANYVSLDLAPWALNWVPFGWVATDQINIWYTPFVLRTTDAFVYQFLDPIVRDPLNLNVWINSTIALINETVSGFINGVIGEINYLFGWILPPLPPLPGAAATEFSLSADSSSTNDVSAVPAAARFALVPTDEVTATDTEATPTATDVLPGAVSDGVGTAPAVLTPDAAVEVAPETTPVDDTVTTPVDETVTTPVEETVDETEEAPEAPVAAAVDNAAAGDAASTEDAAAQAADEAGDTDQADGAAVDTDQDAAAAKAADKAAAKAGADAAADAAAADAKDSAKSRAGGADADKDKATENTGAGDTSVAKNESTAKTDTANKNNTAANNDTDSGD